MRLDRTAFADSVHFFVAFPLDVDAVGRDAEQRGDVGAHGVLDRADAGAFEDDGGIDVADLVPGRTHAGVGLADEDCGVAPEILGGIVGEHLADVGHAECAHKCVHKSVVKDVAVGMGDRAAVVLEGDAADDQRAALAGGRLRFKTVEVISVADAEVRGRDRCG